MKRFCFRADVACIMAADGALVRLVNSDFEIDAVSLEAAMELLPRAAMREINMRRLAGGQVEMVRIQGLREMAHGQS